MTIKIGNTACKLSEISTIVCFNWKKHKVSLRQTAISSWAWHQWERGYFGNTLQGLLRDKMSSSLSVCPYYLCGRHTQKTWVQFWRIHTRGLFDFSRYDPSHSWKFQHCQLLLYLHWKQDKTTDSISQVLAINICTKSPQSYFSLIPFKNQGLSWHTAWSR